MPLSFAPMRGAVSVGTLEDSCRVSTNDQGDTHPNHKSLFSHEPQLLPGQRSSMEDSIKVWEADQCWYQEPVIRLEPRLLPTSDEEASSNQKDAQGRDEGSNCDNGLG